MITKVLGGITLALGLACWLLYAQVGSARERAAAAESQLETAASANAGLTEAIKTQEARRLQELADRDKELERAEAATVKALAAATRSRASEASWQTRFNQLTRAPDACWNVALPDGVFIGMSADGNTGAG